jgi:hypothetical protein
MAKIPMKPIPIVKFLVKAALQAPSADNSQPWHFTWDGSYLGFCYDVNRVSGLTFQADDPATLLSVGAAIENLSQAADYLGLRFEYLDMSDTDLNAGNYFRVQLKSDKIPELPDSVDDIPLFGRHTNRFSFNKQAIQKGLFTSITSGHELNANARIITEPDKIKSIANLVRNASEIRFQTREVHEWLGKSLRFSTKEVLSGDGLDVATLDLPPGGALFLKFISDWRRMNTLNRIGAFKVLSMIDSAPISKAPALVAITSPSGANNVVDAGRLLTRIWTRLNAAGVAVHPYYVIPDQLQRLRQNRIPDHLITQAQILETEADRIFELNSDSMELRMLLRIGYPKKKPVRSRRLPLETVFTDISRK